EPGRRIAVAGAFLLDAETRLNPSLAAGYFGASGGRRLATTTATVPFVPEPQPPLTATLGRLTDEDRSLGERQRPCPVTGLALGSMGTPVKQVVSGRAVFLCCAGCRAKLLADPGRYLARLPVPVQGRTGSMQDTKSKTQ